jgi:cytochrome c oxidase assembly factor CtaG/putative copper export protein
VAVAAVVVALGAVALAITVTGAGEPQLLLDPGAAVRWALPLVVVARDLAGAVTLGALVLAAFALPRGAGGAWQPALRIAATAAVGWTGLSLAHLVLSYSAVSGRPLGGVNFGRELGSFVTTITYGRTLLVMTVLAAVIATVALAVTTPRGALFVALPVLVVLGMQAEIGHATGTASHELAISSMILHLGGAAVWIGGLATLALVVRHLGADLQVVVRRFSPIAAWCAAIVGVSGLVNAWIRLGSVSALGTRYGALVIVKAVLFGALVWAGWLHRRWSIPQLALPAAVRVFWRIVAVELLVMGAVSGVAVALGASAPPVPQLPPTLPTPAEIVTGHPLPPEPTTLRWLTQFRWDALLAVVCAAGLLVYLRWVWRLRKRGDVWPASRTACWVAGMVVFGWATSGGAAVYGHILFSAHMVQHMVLAIIVPILVVLAAPVTLALRALPHRSDATRGPREWLLALVSSRWTHFFSKPLVAAVLFIGSMVLFYYTPLFQLSLTTYAGHLAMVVHFSLVGYLFVNALIGIDPGPQRASYPFRLLLLFGTMAFHGFFGVALIAGTSLLVPEWFGLLGRPWGPTALDDQQLGGGIAWGIGELPTLLLAIGVAMAWSKDDERAARRSDRAADRDDDAELKAYNAMLAAKAERDS